jgi:hypothetical protein
VIDVETFSPYFPGVSPKQRDELAALEVERSGPVGGGQPVLAYSAEYHVDQPAHATLYFQGGANKGAYLRTADHAPLNAQTFAAGYTVGIATTGKFWIPGAYDYARVIRTGFYGWLGGVRIVGRPLSPDRCLNVVPRSG